MSRTRRWALAGLAVVAFGAGAARAVNQLSYDQLISVVFFEDETAYLDPTAYFCRFIALEDKDDYCKAWIQTVDAKLCKVEVTREIRATHSGGKGRDFMRSRDVFTLANLDLTTLKEPQVDDEKRTSRQVFNAPLNVKWHEGQQYAVALDATGAYKACVVDGAERTIDEATCIEGGKEPYAGSKTMTLAYNSQNYNRAMAALRWLQKEHCPKGDAL